MIHSQSGAITIAIALAAGVVAQAISKHLRVPGIIILLTVGVMLGPDVLNIVRPQNLGSGLYDLIGFAVAIILFEGGLQLEIPRLRSQLPVISRLLTIGPIITASLAGLAAWYFMGWNWKLSILFGTLVIVTGPTVVTPLLRRLGLKRDIKMILEAEGVLIDPIGAIIAVIGLEIALSPNFLSLGNAVVDLGGRLAIGLALGIVGGFVVGWLARHESLIPEELDNVFVLALVYLLFEVSNSFISESGILAVTTAGAVLGTMGLSQKRVLVEFKEQLTVLLIGLLFIVLAADVRLSTVASLGTEGVMTVVVLMFVVRPVQILLCTFGTPIGWRERLFMSWLAPRGIVAAAVASLFAIDLANAGIEGGTEVRALVFLVIALTVTCQGLSAYFLARGLDLVRVSDMGYVIVGANRLARLLGKLLIMGGEEVVIVDRNSLECQAAEQDGFRVIFGNALKEQTLVRAAVDIRKGVISMTPNEGVNQLVAKKLFEIARGPRAMAAVRTHMDLKNIARGRKQIKFLFSSKIDFELWLHRLDRKTAILQLWTFVGSKPIMINPEGKSKTFGPTPYSMLPLITIEKNIVAPVVDGTELKQGTQFLTLQFASSADSDRQWMQERQFEWVQSKGLDEKLDLLGTVSK
jgi:NhaP-type Na+/H+ or K+/H+ antiporter